MTIGESLRRFRKEHGITQTGIADKLGILQQTYYKYETDKVTPSAEFIIKLAQVFDVSADYLLGLSDKPRPQEYDEREVEEAFALRDALKNVMRDSVISAK